LRRLLLLGLTGLALCDLARAATPPRIELAVTPAWKGWSRPGRATELDLRLRTDAPVRATIEVRAGQQTLRTALDLQPGRAVRVHLPVSAAEQLAVDVTLPGAPPQRSDIRIAQSESPLLGAALAPGESVVLDGFHGLTLTADDLPRHASAYASIDALVVDAPTLGALDPKQLGALLAHAAACGRIVVVNTDPRVSRLLDGAPGCAGRALMTATSLAQAAEMLKSSLAASLPAAMAPVGMGALARPGLAVWNRVTVLLAVYFAAALLALMFTASPPVLLLLPVLAGVASLALLHALPATSPLLIWSEGAAGAPAARYQAWQPFPGRVRERMRVPIPPLLAATAQPCDASQAMHFDFDASRGLAAFAEFDTRLFGQAALCYEGSFPMSRALTVEAKADGRREVRNAGTAAWPRGSFLAAGLVHELPALAAGAGTSLATPAGQAPGNALLRTAMARLQPGAAAALWQLDLGGVVDVPAGSQGWLLVSVAPP